MNVSVQERLDVYDRYADLLAVRDDCWLDRIVLLRQQGRLLLRQKLLQQNNRLQLIKILLIFKKISFIKIKSNKIHRKLEFLQLVQTFRKKPNGKKRRCLKSKTHHPLCGRETVPIPRTAERAFREKTVRRSAPGRKKQGA